MVLAKASLAITIHRGIKVPGILRIRKFVVGLTMFLTILVAGLVGPLLYTVDPGVMIDRRYLPPMSRGILKQENIYPLGTDALGRDVLAQFLHGIRGSLLVGSVAAGISLVLAIFLGTIAAVFGGLIDKVILTVSEIFIIIPAMILMMILAAYLRERNLWIVAFVIGITSWGGWARGFRSRTLSILSSDFISLAMLSGASRFSIIVKDILPVISPYILAAFAMLFSFSIMSEVGLTIIGVGMTKDITLGLVLYIAQLYANITQGIWWTFVLPTITIIAIYLSLYMIAISLDEYFSPKFATS
ncbi:MAG: ABC transporter permease [Ignisphaera sp.]